MGSLAEQELEVNTRLCIMEKDSMKLQKTIRRMMHKPGVGYFGTIEDDLDGPELKEVFAKMTPHIMRPRLLFKRKATRFKTKGLRFTVIPYNGLGWVNVIFLPQMFFHEWLHFFIFAKTGRQFLGTLLPGVLDVVIGITAAIGVFVFHQLWALYPLLPASMMSFANIEGDFASAWKLQRRNENE